MELTVDLRDGDCLAVLPTLAAGSADALVTDPPYGLAFMGHAWDTLKGPVGPGAAPTAWHAAWAAAALRVLKPGGYATVFGGTRTWHRLACALEDTGFEIRDTLCWLYGRGFPKGDSCLKPAWEPILLCRKPGSRLPLGIDESRIATTHRVPGGRASGKAKNAYGVYSGVRDQEASHRADIGRWPANVAHDGSAEVEEAFAAFGDHAGSSPMNAGFDTSAQHTYHGRRRRPAWPGYADDGSVARFFFCAKASPAERGAHNTHPTVKPLALMRWLIGLVCPPGGLVLDPFLGSGTTALAAVETGRSVVGVERDPAYLAIARRRLAERAGLLTMPGVTWDEPDDSRDD